MSKKQISFWRPQTSGKGCVAFVEFNQEQKTLWLSFVPQGGENGKKFNHDKKINAKLGLTDIGEILSVLTGRTEGLGNKSEKDGKTYFSGLIHKIKDSKNSSIIGLAPSNGQYYFSLSATREGSEPQRFSVGLSSGDQENLITFLRNVSLELFTSESPQPENN